MTSNSALAAVLAITGIVGCFTYRGTAVGAEGPAVGEGVSSSRPFSRRVYDPVSEDRWIGNGIAYGPHRDGQHPGGPSPTEAQIRQDLQLILEHWNLIRLYGSDEPAGTILRVIRAEGLDMKVMLGVWIAVEERRDDGGTVIERFPEARAANRGQVASALRLVSEYPGIVIAVSVGNETQVSWSAHRSPMDLLIGYVREVRAGTTVPVTVADDFNFWNKPESRVLAREIDFITMHAHPLWNGLGLAEALDWTRNTYAEICAVHPERTVVLGESGWATRHGMNGEQATLIQGRTGEAEQEAFYDAFTAWSRGSRVPTFYFEAFDENWKGADRPDEVEKHWGLFRADRSPKRAMAR